MSGHHRLDEISTDISPENEPARSPSFWTKKSEIRHEYKKVQAVLASGPE